MQGNPVEQLPRLEDDEGDLIDSIVILGVEKNGRPLSQVPAWYSILLLEDKKIYTKLFQIDLYKVNTKYDAGDYTFFLEIFDDKGNSNKEN